jgi:hypothetical protein
MKKKIRLSESQLVDLIEKVINENQLVGQQGFVGSNTETTESSSTESKKIKKEDSIAQKYYNKIIKTKNELEKLNDSLTGEKNAMIKNKFRQIEVLMKELQSVLGKRSDVNPL